MGPSWAYWSALGPSWRPPGASLSASWGPLIGPSLGHLWHLGALLGCLGGLLGAFWGPLGPSWGPPGGIWGRLGSNLGRPGALSSELGALLAPRPPSGTTMGESGRAHPGGPNPAYIYIYIYMCVCEYSLSRSIYIYIYIYNMYMYFGYKFVSSFCAHAEFCTRLRQMK